ncbi:9755_t:CDS:2 [Diversispora eburnea]|uniref:9755_t:CDS:1 n=1 Tax=Diversispora eburnea TaxID=1213867 RepID=A0A9N8W8G0_9GLOM|nr:9755_t:CDS:2 [Diversispora eburnea]
MNVGISLKEIIGYPKERLKSCRTQNIVAAAVILLVTTILNNPISIDDNSNVLGMTTLSIKSVCRMIEAEKDKFRDLFPAAITSNINMNMNVNSG